MSSKLLSNKRQYNPCLDTQKSRRTHVIAKIKESGNAHD